jgi:hypothetical protein
VTKASQGAASEPPPVSNDDAQLLTARPGSNLVLCAAAGLMDGAAAGAVNSPKSVRQTAAAAAAAAIHGAGSSSPRRMLGKGPAAGSTARKAAAALESSRQHKPAQQQGQGQGQQPWGLLKCGGADRTSSSSSSADCLPASDISRQAPGKTAHVAQQEPGCASAAAATDSSGFKRGHGNVLNASCKYLLSACAVPPAALLSPRYQGPVETAVLKSSMHTPRH